MSDEQANSPSSAFALKASQHSTRSEKPPLPRSTFARFRPYHKAKRHEMVNSDGPPITGPAGSCGTRKRPKHRLGSGRAFSAGLQPTITDTQIVANMR